jgi:hypothetical protein
MLFFSSANDGASVALRELDLEARDGWWSGHFCCLSAGMQSLKGAIRHIDKFISLDTQILDLCRTAHLLRPHREGSEREVTFGTTLIDNFTLKLK